MVVLTEAERNKFMMWLDHEAHEAMGLAAQCRAIGQVDMDRLLRSEAQAARIIQRKLQIAHVDETGS